EHPLAHRAPAGRRTAVSCGGAPPRPAPAVGQWGAWGRRGALPGAGWDSRRPWGGGDRRVRGGGMAGGPGPGGGPARSPWGHVRGVCSDPAESGERRRAAAAGLAQLAQAGVPGAHPDSWYGLGPQSSQSPLRVLGEPARVSPSLVELVSSCPLRWLLTRHGGEDVRALAAVTGSLVHRLVQAVAAGATDEQLEHALAQAWAGVDAGAAWYSRAEQQRIRQMVEMFRHWWRDSRGE